jgi:hypothetical protein
MKRTDLGVMVNRRVEGFTHYTVISTVFGDTIMLQLTPALGAPRWCRPMVTDTTDPFVDMGPEKLRARAAAWKIAEKELRRFEKIPYPLRRR